MDNNQLTEGNLIKVDINAAQITLSHRAVLLHIPIASGDSWRIRDLGTGKLMYICEGCTVTKLAASIHQE